MAARKALAGFAVLALGAGITASVATALSPCGYRACSDEVAASGLSGQARGACVKQAIADCRAGLCSCTGGSPPCSCVCGDGLCGPSEDCSTCPQDCGPCPTIQCCGSPGGAFVGQCILGTQCDANHPQNLGAGTCNPNPCGGVPPCGTFLLTWGVRSGTANGELSFPVGVATDGSGNVYVADANNGRIQKFDSTGTFLTAWNLGPGQFHFPVGVATDGSGNVYVADAGNGRIQKFACP